MNTSIELAIPTYLAAPYRRVVFLGCEKKSQLDACLYELKTQAEYTSSKSEILGWNNKKAKWVSFSDAAKVITQSCVNKTFLDACEQLAQLSPHSDTKTLFIFLLSLSELDTPQNTDVKNKTIGEITNALLGRLSHPQVEILLQQFHSPSDEDYSTSLAADHFVALLADAGWFDISEVVSDFGLAKNQPRTKQSSQSQHKTTCRTLHHLSHRNYRVRPAEFADLPRLLELEQLCWSHTRMSEERLHSRIERFPQGQFVLEEKGQVNGVLYTQCIRNVDSLDKATAADVHQLHDADGEILQLLALNVDPDVQNRSYGDQLLEYALQWATLDHDISGVVGVTLCKNFSSAIPLEFPDYIRKTGLQQDPVLAFHAAHGAKVIKPISGYRPEDEINHQYGVLVSYDLLNRTQHKKLATNLSKENSLPIDSSSLGEFLQTTAMKLLGANQNDFAADRPFMEMGLASAELLLFQRQLVDFFGEKLEPGFFFEFSNCNSVEHELSRRIQSRQSKVKSLQEVDAKQNQSDFKTKNKTKNKNEIKTESSKNKINEIAIVGIACKLPGGLDSPEAFWQCLENGECMIGDYPSERDAGNIWPKDSSILRGGFMQGADQFDAEFFRMTPAETVITDPQQRLLLELSWACLENAGVIPETLGGTNTAVFVGASNTDYSRLIQAYGVDIPAHHTTGSALSILANRISYFFDLNGPSLVIDTACSSSLVALHSAIRSLRQGECTAALVGAVNLICHPDLSTAYQKAGMLSPDALCKVFDHNANGYVRSEGAVMLLLKPLQDAIDDGDRIEAIIRGSAINHGGLASGLTVPNPRKQAELIASAWKDAGVNGSDISFIETHGTGTSLGDPIEVQGILAANNSLPKSQQFNECWIGSVKSNLGHLEPAAGLTGLLKAVLSLQNRKFPRTINCTQLNNNIELENSALAVATQEVIFSSELILTAGVSSFGSGGANGHVVLCQAPRMEEQSGAEVTPLLMLSARSVANLREYAQHLVDYLETKIPCENFESLLYVYQYCRTHMDFRLAISAKSDDELLKKLKAWLVDVEKNHEGLWINHCKSTDATAIDKDLSVDAVATAWVNGQVFAKKQSSSGSVKQLTNIRPISAPGYPFNRSSFWIAAPSGFNTATSVKSAVASKTQSHTATEHIEWKQLRESELYRQGNFCCLGLGIIINVMLTVFCRNNPMANDCVINNFEYFPLPATLGDYLVCEVRCTRNRDELFIELVHGTDGKNGTVASAMLQIGNSLSVFDAASHRSTSLLVPAIANQIFPLVVRKLAASLFLPRLVFSDLKDLSMATLISDGNEGLSLRTSDHRELVTITTEEVVV